MSEPAKASVPPIKFPAHWSVFDLFVFLARSYGRTVIVPWVGR